MLRNYLKLHSIANTNSKLLKSTVYNMHYRIRYILACQISAKSGNSFVKSVNTKEINCINLQLAVPIDHIA